MCARVPAWAIGIGSIDDICEVECFRWTAFFSLPGALSSPSTAVFKNPENRAFQGGRFSRFSIAFFAFSAEAFFFGSAFFAFSAVRVCSVPAASSRLTVVCSVMSSSHCGAPLHLSGKKVMHGGAPRSALVAWGEHWRLRSCFFRSPSRLIQDLPRVWLVGHAPTGM